ncbi:hypothetical protein AGABI2DRAFT_194393 [Agaricus bisporus var. bisporus H97]|uniref:hypothetical protein n=1 Tax=Agaricus bisporus var. bisporus (strain H97 / ATCC MYA-4626 / FGSC 10389) TaxID=936046 RepID=UPI00029F59D7|nr:hypothetical protein AGABI2DRAFT_194393 [Agaricus bisporus var. bisporus H97]EKV44299.1 hypothetical protein AGABI2DRAFT_194393 [Agaricus bisporus var. bisporus H97]
MTQTVPTVDLPEHLRAAPPIIVSVMQTFQITRSFVAGIDDYHHSDKFTTEWYDFLDRYVIMMWNSRDICIGARFQLVKLNGVLTFAMQDPPNMEVIKAKVNDYLNTPDSTVPKSRELVDNLKQLDDDIEQWKVTVFDWIDKNVPKHDDGTSTYRMLMKALSDLKERLPHEDRTDMKSAWFSDSLKPTTVSTVQIQGAWLDVWFTAQLVTNEINAAPDTLTIKKLRRQIEQAFADYKPLDAACESYEGDLHKDLYHAYNEAIHRHG